MHRFPRLKFYDKMSSGKSYKMSLKKRFISTTAIIKQNTHWFRYYKVLTKEKTKQTWGTFQLSLDFPRFWSHDFLHCLNEMFTSQWRDITGQERPVLWYHHSLPLHTDHCPEIMSRAVAQKTRLVSFTLIWLLGWLTRERRASWCLDDDDGGKHDKPKSRLGVRMLMLHSGFLRYFGEWLQNIGFVTLLVMTRWFCLGVVWFVLDTSSCLYLLMCLNVSSHSEILC